jgi:hypothetical protein
LERGAPFPEHPSFVFSKSPVYEPLSRFLSAVKGLLWKETPVTGAFLYISSKVPSKVASPRPSPLNLFRERVREREREGGRDSTSGAPFIHLSKSLVDKLPSKFPSEAPMERDTRL